jgi:ubiquinone/menaquinone biosynthesis C-methylase UbiE
LKPLDSLPIGGVIGRIMHDTRQDFFDNLATKWDLNITAEDLERLTLLLDKLEIKPGMDIIDLGCGTGILFDILRRKVGENGNITGIDFSFAMVARAKQNFSFPNVNVVNTDVMELPFRDSCFDMGFIYAAFPHFSDKRKSLEELHRVLKPNAHLHVIHLLSSQELAEMHHRVGGTVAHDHLPPTEKMRTLFESSGFVHISIEDHPGLYIASGKNNK